MKLRMFLLLAFVASLCTASRLKDVLEERLASLLEKRLTEESLALDCATRKVLESGNRGYYCMGWTQYNKVRKAEIAAWKKLHPTVSWAAFPGKQCSPQTDSRRPTGVYTAGYSGCDGWSKLTVDSCKAKCEANELPPGCGMISGKICNFIQWTKIKDPVSTVETGWCHLAETCTMRGESRTAVFAINGAAEDSVAERLANMFEERLELRKKDNICCNRFLNICC